MDMPIYRYHRVICSGHWLPPGVLVCSPVDGSDAWGMPSNLSVAVSWARPRWPSLRPNSGWCQRSWMWSTF